MNKKHQNYPKHIAIIMDGNRRWAKEHGLEVKKGHKEGADNLERIVKFCNEIGIEYLTVYAFSTENWKRSENEVGALMILLQNYLDNFFKKANNENIKLQIIGDISALSKGLQFSIIKAVENTKNNTGIKFNIAFNYGGRTEIISGIKKVAEEIKNNKLSIEDITEEMFSNYLYTKGMPDPDLVIRTSGEIRMSNFLTWQSVYSELYFCKKYWPDFKNDDLMEAINEYTKRTRKFGGK